MVKFVAILIATPIVLIGFVLVSENVSAQSAPDLRDLSANVIGPHNASLSVFVDPNGSRTDLYFKYWTGSAHLQRLYMGAQGDSFIKIEMGLINLQEGTTYSFQVVAQNSFGSITSPVGSFITPGDSGSSSSGSSTGSYSGSTNNTGYSGSSVSSGNTSTNTSSTGGQSSGGSQVLGTVSPSNGANINGSASGTTNSFVTGNQAPVKKASTKQINLRPSFISLEYSLAEDGALVHVADNTKPGPGDDFTYTVVYKNDTDFMFSDSRLKVIIPADAYYVSSNIDPLQISGSTVEFNLDTIKPNSQGEVVVVSKIREKVDADTNLIFTSVLTYKDRLGVQLATTSYLTVKTGEGENKSSLSASFLGSMFGSSGVLVLVALGLVSLMSLLTYYVVKVKRINGNGKNGKKDDDDLGLGHIPSTFEPIGPIDSVRR